MAREARALLEDDDGFLVERAEADDGWVLLACPYTRLAFVDEVVRTEDDAYIHGEDPVDAYGSWDSTTGAPTVH